MPESKTSVLAIRNERPLGSHSDVYEALDRLAADGVMDEYVVYPYLQRLHEGVSHSAISEGILETARQRCADLIIWMHTGSLMVSDECLESLRALPDSPTMVYWEGDSYHSWFKPLPSSMLTVMRRCVFPLIRRWCCWCLKPPARGMRRHRRCCAGQGRSLAAWQQV